MSGDDSKGKTPELTEDERLFADLQLIRRVKTGSREAKSELCTRLYRRVHGLTRHLSRNDAEAEDLAQEALLQILDSVKNYRAEGSLESWADVVAVRTVRKKLNRLRRTRWLLGGEWLEPSSPSSDPEQGAAKRSRRQRVAELLNRLPPDRRLILVLKLVQGYTAQEVADQVGLPLPDVQYQIKKGRGQLRRWVLKDSALRELFPGVAS